MYGWTADAGGPPPHPDHQKEPVAEPQTLQAPITFTAPPPQEVSEGPGTLQQQPGTLQQQPGTLQQHEQPGTLQQPEQPGTLQKPQETPQGEEELPHNSCCDDGSGGEEDGYLIFDDNDGEGSDNEDAVPDGDGAIKPYIRFTDRFPSDLSWNDIVVDPLSS